MIKIVKLYMKHDDRTDISLIDENGNVVEEKNSDYFPYVGILGGDDTLLKIDNETGKIIGWKPIETFKGE